MILPVIKAKVPGLAAICCMLGACLVCLGTRQQRSSNIFAHNISHITSWWYTCASEEGCQDGTGNPYKGLGCVHNNYKNEAAGPTSALTKSAKSCSHCLSATVSKAEPTSPMTTGKRRPL